MKTTAKLAAEACLMVAALTACGDYGPSAPSGPGFFQADLISPNGPEGAAVFQVSGGSGLGDVTVTSGDVFYDHGIGTTRIIVLRDEPGPIGFRIRTDNVGALPTVAVTQVADGDDGLRESLAGYDVRLVQVEDGGAP